MSLAVLPGELLTDDRDLLEGVLTCLTGVEALAAAATCKAFRDALAPSETKIWAEFFAKEFADKDFLFPAPISYARRYRIAHRRVHFCAARWARVRTSSEGPGARQGAASCPMATFGGAFAVYGGWTDARGIQRDLHLLRRAQATSESETSHEEHTVGSWQWEQVALANVRTNGPARATYGPSVTWVATEAGAPTAKLLVLGGVTSGGYRGATGALHTIQIACARGSDASGGEQQGADGAEGEDGGEGSGRVAHLPKLEAAWTDEGSVDGRPRAYHSAVFLPPGGEAHPTNQNKLWVFGGFNDHTPGGCMAALEAFDVAARSWDPLPLGSSGQPEPRARLGHSCVALGGQLFVSGGCTDSSNMKPGEGGEELSDVWVLDTRIESADLTWSCVSMPNHAPPNALQRCHSAVSLGKSILFFGGGRSTSLTNGLTVYDTCSRRWSSGTSTLSGRPPTTRQNAQCGIIPGTGVLVVFGGWKLGPVGQDKNLGDTFLLDLDHDPAVKPENEEDEEDDDDEDDEAGADEGEQDGWGAMMANLPPGVTVVGNHPMFGPIVDMGGQLVPLMMVMNIGGVQENNDPSSGEDSDDDDDDESNDEGGEESDDQDGGEGSTDGDEGGEEVGVA